MPNDDKIKVIISLSTNNDELDREFDLTPEAYNILGLSLANDDSKYVAVIVGETHTVIINKNNIVAVEAIGSENTELQSQGESTPEVVSGQDIGTPSVLN